MSELSGLYALWYREIKVFASEKSRIVSSMIQPLMWLVIFGTGLGSSISLGSFGGGYGYTSFIYPGILAMTVLFGSIFFGLYIIMDKRVDFLKEVMVAPISRTTIFLGKVLGGATDSLIEVLILLVLGSLFFSIHFTPYSLVVTVVFVTLLTASMVSIGLVIGAMMSSPEGFGLIAGFLIFPLFFLSGALFPVSNLPSWLYVFVRLNPVSYAFDGMRGAILGISTFGMIQDFAAIAGFAVAMLIIGTVVFRRMKI